MQHRLLKSATSAFLVLLLAKTACLADESLLSIGQRLYNNHDYAGASEFFRVAAETQGASAQAHYLYANSLAKQFRGQQAAQQYRECLKRNPSPAMAQYCRMALQTYGQSTNVPPEERQFSGLQATVVHKGPTPVALRDQARQLDAATRIAQQAQAADRQLNEDGLAQAADSLQNQLDAHTTAHTSVILQPLGTGLYVRNYQPIGSLYDDDKIVVPQKATALKFTAPQLTKDHSDPF